MQTSSSLINKNIQTQVQNTTGLLLLIVDKKNNICRANKPALDLLGYTEKEIVKMNLLQLVPASFKVEIKKMLNQLFSGQILNNFFPIITKGKTYLAFDISLASLRSNTEKEYYCLLRNISVFSEEKNPFSQICNVVNSPLLLYSTDYDVIVDINHAFESTFGYSKPDIFGKQMQNADLFQKSADVQNLISSLQSDNILREVDTFLMDSRGVSTAYTLVFDPLIIQSVKFLLITFKISNPDCDTESRLQYQLYQQKLIADISQELSSEDFYSKLDQMLHRLGKHTGVSRVYIFEDTADGIFTNNTFEWCNEGIDPQIDNLKDIPNEIIPNWKVLMYRDGRIFSKNIRELPEDLSSALEPQGIKSILIYPILADEIIVGFIGFDECTRNKSWSQAELDLLKLISHILSNAFQRRLMHQRIKEKQVMLELIVGNANEGIWDWNILTNEVIYDSTWAGMLGYDAIELKNNLSTWENLINPEDKEKVFIDLNAHLDGKTEIFESTYRLKTKSGDWKWIMDKGKIISYTDQNKPARAIGKHTDLTEIKQNEEKLKAGLLKEKELNDLKSRFVSNASHEFRTPLASILLISDVLQQYWDKLEKDQIAERIKKITDQATHLTGIVNKVFEISKFQSGKAGFSPEELDLVELCQKVIDGFNPFLEHKNRISFYTSIKSYFAPIDKRLMIQALNNLLSNSLKYSPENSFVKVKLLHNQKEVQIQITDSGIGIPMEDQKHLFEPFFRATNTADYPGNGLGLNIARESMLLHKGDIKVCSTVGKGSTFIICLPKVVSQAKEEEKMSFAKN